MANKNRVLGQVRIRIDGELLETDGQSTIDLGGPNREAVQGDYQAGAFREGTNPSRVECSVLMKQGFSPARLRAIDNATISIEADTGHGYVIRNAYMAEPPSITTGEGKARCVFSGPPAESL